jgi:very-short-patch-repair endonuclease
MTRTHMKLSEALRHQGEQHRNEVRFCAPGWEYGYTADIYLSRRRALVEVDGPSHYGRERRDRIRDTKFREDLGIPTIRIRNSEIERDADRAARKILSQLNRLW